jgi:hypothetical protein
MKKSFCF